MVPPVLRGTRLTEDEANTIALAALQWDQDREQHETGTPASANGWSNIEAQDSGN